MSSFPTVPEVTHRSICRRCRKLFVPGDAVQRALVVAGVGPGPTGARCTHVDEDYELIHFDCKNPKSPCVHPLADRSKLVPSKTLPLAVRTPDFQCRVCGVTFVREDRIVEVLLVEGIALDPDTKAPAVQCCAGAEYAHKDCRDRALKGLVGLVL